MNALRAAVIGVGYLGRFHAEKYAALPEAELIAVVDADQARAAEIAAKTGCRALADYRSLLGQVDVVSIVVPTVHHFSVAKDFLENGANVLLEKPIAVSLEQADELIRIAAATGVTLQIGHIERFNPAVAAIRPLLAAPRYLTAERSAPFTVRCTDVNVILDLMIHDLDIVADIAGAEPREVSAAGASVITREIDQASARIVFANGCIADVTASRVSEEKKRTLRVFDGAQVFASDYQTQKAVLWKSTGGDAPGFAPRELGAERADTLLEEIRAFLSAVRHKTRPLVSGREGRNALALAQVITNTIEQGVTGFVRLTT